MRCQSQSLQLESKMKTLGVFLLAVLGWSLTEGRVVSKCELWGELKNTTTKLVPKHRNLDYVLAESK